MDFTKQKIFLSLLVLNISFTLATEIETVSAEDKKRQFSLFTVVTFPNDQCTAPSSSSTGVAYGTCLSASECSDKSGTIDGNCAAGFGVCCTFKVRTCGSTISQNLTYVQNPSYSSSYTVTSTTACSYSVKPVSKSICQLRLDFDHFDLKESSNTCTDTFAVTGPTNTNALSDLCGTLTGQHLYVENGSSTSSTKLAFTIATTTGVKWNIKVSQIPCYAPYKAPSDCAQWLTGATGYVQSYGNAGGAQIKSQSWSYCVRRERGYCFIQYTPDAGATIDAFYTEGPTTAVTLFTAASGVDATLMINGLLNTPNSIVVGTRFSFGTSTSIASPADTGLIAAGPRFILTHNVEDAGTETAATGFNLAYMQLPCGTLPETTISL